jgi:hypothetical protein
MTRRLLSDALTSSDKRQRLRRSPAQPESFAAGKALSPGIKASCL